MAALQRRFAATALLFALLFALGHTPAQERFSLFVGSDPKSVARMVNLAGLRDGDVVIDLGAGDGRIVFAALKANPTVRGIGVDIDENLVRQATATAQNDGLAERVTFLHQNVFDADLSQVDVIFMWLFPDLMRLLRVKILEEARPGTRVVANLWGMGSWAPDATDKGDGISDVLMWIVPAKVGGYWEWDLTLDGVRRKYSAVFEQRFQEVEGVVRAGERRGVFTDIKLRGTEISFVLSMTLGGLGHARHEFTGRVSGDRMEGVVRVMMPPRTQEEDEELETLILPWSAARTSASAFFAPTGVDVR